MNLLLLSVMSHGSMNLILKITVIDLCTTNRTVEALP